jgi:uncharacterized membrane protein
MSDATSKAYQIVAYEFVGRERAMDVVNLIKKDRRADDFKVPAWAVVEVDDKGKTHVRQSGHGGIGTAVGTGVGALLGLIGGPAGLLIWALGGALIGGVAGKYLGHQFDTNELKALAVDMGPNTSAILVVIEQSISGDIAAALNEYGAKAVTVTLGSQVSGEVASFGTVAVGDEGAAADAQA